MSLSDYFAEKIEDPGHIFLFYGPEYTGKTFTAMTAAKDGRPVIFIDTELRAEEKRMNFFNEFPDLHVIEAVVLDKLVQNPTMHGIDEEKTVARILNALIEISKDPEYKNAVIVIDSVSEAWRYIQMAGKRRLARAGKIDLDTFAIKTQFDWGPITATHDKLMMLCRLLTRSGADVVLTARAKWYPEYVNEKKDVYMTCQKDVGFHSDAIVQFRRKLKDGNMVGDVTAIIEKAGNNEISRMEKITNPTFQEIHGLIMKEKS